MAEVKWFETTSEVYFAIYKEHAAALRVHGTISHVDHPDYGFHMMTEWGLPEADFPFIKIDIRGPDSSQTERHYYLAAAQKDTP